MTQDRMSQERVGSQNGGKPMTSHPLFPAVVALWFAALFGLGSLAIRPALLEGLVMRSGIDLIVPAAAPPLGVTARILIALIMSAFGAATGVVLARRLNRPASEDRIRRRAAQPAAAEADGRSRDSHPDAPARRPISAHDELGDRLDSPVAGHGVMAGRRRPLAIDVTEEPFQPRDLAPLPGGLPQIFEVADEDFAAPENAPRFDDSPQDAPLDLRAFATPDFHAPQEFQPRASFAAPEVADFGAPVVEAADHAAANEVADAPAELVAPALAATPAEAVTTESDPAELGMTDLALRLRDSMARRRAAKAKAAEIPAPEPVAEPEAAVAPLFGSPEGIDVPAVPEIVIPPAPIPMPAALRPLDFGATDDDGESAAIDPLDIMLPRHLAMPEPAEQDEEPVAVADEAPEAVSEPGDETVPVEAAVADADPAEAVADDAVDEEAFASLLEIGQPAAVSTDEQGFVRVDDEPPARDTIEPVVIFPGQGMAAPAPFAAPITTASPAAAPFAEPALRRFDAPAAAAHGAPIAMVGPAPVVDPEAAEQALRAALANLQRMSGAA